MYKYQYLKDTLVSSSQSTSKYCLSREVSDLFITQQLLSIMMTNHSREVASYIIDIINNSTLRSNNGGGWYTGWRLFPFPARPSFKYHYIVGVNVDDYCYIYLRYHFFENYNVYFTRYWEQWSLSPPNKIIGVRG